jgi:hypothetical protein
MVSLVWLQWAQITPPFAWSIWPLIQAPSGPARKGNGIGNIFRLSEPLERREFGELIDGVGLSKVPNVDFANMSWRRFGS